MYTNITLLYCSICVKKKKPENAQKLLFEQLFFLTHNFHIWWLRFRKHPSGNFGNPINFPPTRKRIAQVKCKRILKENCSGTTSDTLPAMERSCPIRGTYMSVRASHGKVCATLIVQTGPLTRTRKGRTKKRKVSPSNLHCDGRVRSLEIRTFVAADVRRTKRPECVVVFSFDSSLCFFFFLSFVLKLLVTLHSPTTPSNLFSPSFKTDDRRETARSLPPNVTAVVHWKWTQLMSFVGDVQARKTTNDSNAYLAVSVSYKIEIEQR